MTTRIRNDSFNSSRGLERGRSKQVELFWYACKVIFFLTAIPWPSAWKVLILRLFGAQVGKGVVLKPRINIHLPWRLTVGDYTWIGEEVFILNLAEVAIGSHCCLSQRAFLCTGNHDFRRTDMAYRNRPIFIGDGAWVGAQSFVGPGVSVGSESVLTAGSVATRDVPPGMICGGVPCEPLRRRWPEVFES